MLIQSQSIQCPYCCQFIELSVDCSISFQNYIEDCQICCSPIQLHIEIDPEQNVTIDARMENE